MSKLLDWCMNFAALGVVVVGIWVMGPVIETRWFPVYSKFKLVNVETNSHGGSIVTVEAYKFRDCLPQGYAWYNGDFGNNVRQLTVQSRRQLNVSPSLPLGKFTSAFEVDIQPIEIASGISAETFSRCHPFWTTRTIVFP